MRFSDSGQLASWPLARVTRARARYSFGTHFAIDAGLVALGLDGVAFHQNAFLLQV